MIHAIRNLQRGGLKDSSPQLKGMTQISQAVRHFIALPVDMLNLTAPIVSQKSFAGVDDIKKRVVSRAIIVNESH